MTTTYNEGSLDLVYTEVPAQLLRFDYPVELIRQEEYDLRREVLDQGGGYPHERVITQIVSAQLYREGLRPEVVGVWGRFLEGLQREASHRSQDMLTISACMLRLAIRVPEDRDMLNSITRHGGSRTTMDLDRDLRTMSWTMVIHSPRGIVRDLAAPPARQFMASTPSSAEPQFERMLREDVDHSPWVITELPPLPEEVPQGELAPRKTKRVSVSIPTPGPEAESPRRLKLRRGRDN